MGRRSTKIPDVTTDSPLWGNELQEVRNERAALCGVVNRVCGILRIESGADALAAWCDLKEREEREAKTRGAA